MMKEDSCCCAESGRNIGLLALRIAVGVIFIYQGWAKLNGIEGVTEMFAGMGFPAAGFFAYLVGIAELVSGIAVLLGVFTKIFALVLAIIMVVALLVVHTKTPFNEAFLAISLLGSSLALFGLGGGDWKLVKNELCPCQCKKK